MQDTPSFHRCAAASLSLDRDQLDSLLQVMPRVDSSNQDCFLATLHPLASLQGTGQIYQSLQIRLNLHLHNFRQYATETCLHVPIGLIAAQVWCVAQLRLTQNIKREAEQRPNAG